MAEEGHGTSSSKKRRIESLEKRIKGGGGLMGLSALSARTTKKQQPTHQHRRRPDKVEGGGAGPGGAGFGSNGGRGFGSGGGGGAKRAGGPADAKPRAPERSDPSRLRFGADASTSRGSDGGPDAAWYAPIGSRTRAGVMSSAHARAFPRNLLPTSDSRGDDDGSSGGDASDAATRRAWIQQHLRDLVATNPKAGADAEAVITSKTKDKALLLDSANGAFSVDEVRAARARRLARAGRDARLVGAAARRRRCGRAVVPVDKARWETFLPLHELWRAYVAGLLQGGSSGGTAGGEREAKGEREAERRLGSAELVGAAVTVSACERPSLCGTRGIVARDSARCVVLVTRGDELVTVPKKGARFEVEAEVPRERVGGSGGGGGGVEGRIVRVSLDGDSLGALVGLAAKAKAASAKVGDVVGDFLDNSVDNPLYEDDEDAEWSEDGDDEDEDLDGTDDGIDSPAPAPSQSSALAQLRARLAAERAKKAGDASEARAKPSSSATSGLMPAEPGSLRPYVPNGSLPPAPPTPVAPQSTTASPLPPPPPQPEVTTPTMTPVRPPQPPRAAAAASPTSGVVGAVPSVVPTSPGGTPIAASMSALEQRARAAEEETARLRRRIDADARAAETEKQRAVAAAVAEAMEREQRKAAAMMEAMVEADGAASAAHDAATIGALREELRAVRAAAGDVEATWAGRLEEAAAEEEELRRRLTRAEERATAAEAEAAAARAGEDDNGAEAEELRDALARERARARGEIEARDAEIEKNQKELVRLRHHLLELEEEDDAKAEEAELNATALVREREEEHAALVNELTARLAASERELEVMRVAVDAKDRELANLQVAMDIFNTDEEARGRLSLEAQALREKNAHLAAELVVAKEQVTAANERASGAERDARAEKERADAAAAETQRAIGEAGKARRALQQSMQQAKHLMDSSTELLDKRIVSKLLLTYFEREQSPDVLELMARMLNMSEDEKSKMGLGERAAAKPGLIRSVATAPVRVAFGALGFAGTVAKTALQTPVHVARALTPEEEKQTVADQWVEFLLSQMDAADEDEIAGKKFKVQPIAAPATPGP